MYFIAKSMMFVWCCRRRGGGSASEEAARPLEPRPQHQSRPGAGREERTAQTAVGTTGLSQPVRQGVPGARKVHPGYKQN